MEQSIRFQGHDFNMIEEGLYKTEDDFIMDDDDFLGGDYGDLVIAGEIINGEWHPRYLSRFEYYEKIEAIVYSNTNYSIAERPDLNSPYISLGYLAVEE